MLDDSSMSGALAVRVSFAAAYGGERVLGNILLPQNVRPPYQAVIWFPGAYALQLKSSEGDLPFSLYFDFVARSGRALVYPVYGDMYERRRSVPPAAVGSAQLPAINEERDQVVRWVKDFSRTVGYLESRGDIDVSRIAYYGYSLDAVASLPILAVEQRLRTAIPSHRRSRHRSLYPGGRSGQLSPASEAAGSHARRTVRLRFPRRDLAKPMFNLLATPAQHKRLVIFENAGHMPPRIDLIREVLDWLDRYLGPVQR
jgi:hypothetical protein